MGKLLEALEIVLVAFAVGGWWGKRIAKFAYRKELVRLKEQRTKRRELETRRIVQEELGRMLVSVSAEKPDRAVDARELN